MMLGLGGGRLCKMLVVGSRKEKGGFAGGRTPLGPGQSYQSEVLLALGELGAFLQFLMNCWKAVSFAAGMSASAT